MYPQDIPLLVALALTSTLSLNAWAKLPEPTKPVPKSIQLLQADPSLVHRLGLSADEQNALMDEVIRASEQERPAAPATSAGDGKDGLIHKANFFEDLFGGAEPPPRPAAPAIRMPRAPKEPVVVFDHASMADPDDWKVKYFDVVIVINKAKSGQTIHVYQKIDDAMPVLVKNGAKVSTGREIPELSNEDRYAAGMAESDHAPKSSYFSNTPTGYWTPIRLSIDHVSGDWEDAAMDHAVFFHPRGIATHRAPVGTEDKLGRRASGACIRMNRADARDLFWLVRRTGGPVTPGEMAGGNFERTAPGPSFAKELAAQRAQGFNTYDVTPEIPDFDRSGNIKMEADGVTPVMRPSLSRTLVVVESRETARPRAADLGR